PVTTCFSNELWMTEASIPTEKTAKCGNPGMAKTAGLRVVCRAMSKVFRPRAPIDGYQTGTTFLRKRTSPTSRRFLVKARRFQDLPCPCRTRPGRNSMDSRPLNAFYTFRIGAQLTKTETFIGKSQDRVIYYRTLM